MNESVLYDVEKEQAYGSDKICWVYRTSDFWYPADGKAEKLDMWGLISVDLC